MNLKSGATTLASIRIISKRTDRPLTPILHENIVGFVGYENGEICFEIINQTDFDLTIDILDTNKDKINKINRLRPKKK